ncbi:MAG: YceH family protein [Burkholderiaceae bacterium]
MTDPILSPVEARIVAVLLEKKLTVPDTYPLSLSALVSGCNQKSAREPVMALDDQDVLVALEKLRRQSWVIESSGSRVSRYEQNAARVLGIAGNGMILLAVLMLRGPQTVAELRANSQRWYAFVDASSVEAFLNELAERSSGALVVKLPRQPGARESRWAHLLCGDVIVPDKVAVREPVGPVAGQESGRLETLERRITALEQQVSELRESLSQKSVSDQ